MPLRFPEDGDVGCGVSALASPASLVGLTLLLWFIFRHGGGVARGYLCTQVHCQPDLVSAVQRSARPKVLAETFPHFLASPAPPL